MSRIQHRLGRQMLQVIGNEPSERRLFTYQSLSHELGRQPLTDGRAMAQVCDLLDAAAAVAGVPLYALVRVRNAKGQINPMAWRKGVPGWVRPAVIRRSEHHEFSDADIASIGSGLQQLDGLGNRAAWRSLSERLGSEEVWRRVTQPAQRADSRDAIDDLGADVPSQMTVTTIRYQRDDAVRERVLNLSLGRCELCGQEGFLKPNGKPYVETHHIIALASDGADRINNVVALCANHHRQAHFGADRELIEQRLVSIARSPNRGTTRHNSS
jgi:hypothetical protein